MTRNVLVFLLIVPLLVGQNLCDLNSDDVVNSTDVGLAKSMVLGSIPCTMTVLGSTICNAVAVQRVVNASFPGASCVTGTTSQHSLVSLTWVASETPDVGYLAFRGDVSGGPYTQLNASSVSELAYLDNTTSEGQTYYYVVTAVDISSNQSVYSNEAGATTLSAPGPMQGSLFVATVSGSRGTTVSIPMTLTNDLQRGVGILQFTVTLPLWASGKATVTSGTAATIAGKTVSCRWQRAGLTTIPLKCILVGDALTDMEDGVIANINVPLPATLKGTVSIAVGGAVASSNAGDTISIIGQSGKLTSMSVGVPVRNFEAGVVTPSEEQSSGMVFAPNPVQIPTPVLEAPDCKILGSEIECTIKYNVVPTGWLKVDIFSSNEDYVKSSKFLTGPQKETNIFRISVIKIPPSGTKIVLGIGVEGQQVLSNTIVWP